jgi:hypothetical protein
VVPAGSRAPHALAVLGLVILLMVSGVVPNLVAVLIGCLQPLTAHDTVRALADAGVTSFAMEAIPRITRAQSMDALSSQATVGGYRAALMAAEHLPRFFPIMNTAAPDSKFYSPNPMELHKKQVCMRVISSHTLTIYRLKTSITTWTM